MTARPAIFKWRQTEPKLILCAVRWYLRYSLSLRWVSGSDVRRNIDFIEKLFELAA
jgi:transposase-like protein